MEQVAETHGWNLDDVEIFELVPAELSLDPKQQQTVVYAFDLELGETTKMTFDELVRVAPARVVFDSLSEIRLLAQNPLRYRRQVIALKHFLAQQGCTALFLDDLTEHGDEAAESDFLGNARALLFPIDWPEPFGLVMIEAMACGTPVIAVHCGSVPEVIDNATTGFVVGDLDEAVSAVQRIDRLNRPAVRATFERRFTVERMAKEYLAIHRSLPAVRRTTMRSNALSPEAGRHKGI